MESGNMQLVGGYVVLEAKAIQVAIGLSSDLAFSKQAG